ncbi:MAG: PQQ-dependent sugar dehydrogenase, partial [Thaumarchaeota archaeon]
MLAFIDQALARIGLQQQHPLVKVIPQHDIIVRGFLIVATMVLLLANSIALIIPLDPAAALTIVPDKFVHSDFAIGLKAPTAMEFSPDGRLFVTEKGGSVRIVKDGVLLSSAFVIVPVNSVGERGLLGIAFDPNFESNNYVYLYYTTSTSPIHNRVSRFTASPTNPDIAAAGSESVLIDLETLGTTTHNAGAIHFGNDGKLYIATGDNNVSNNAQSLT